jgi:hypothetical protein
MPNWMFNNFFDYHKILAKLLLLSERQPTRIQCALVLVQTYHHLNQRSEQALSFLESVLSNRMKTE